jgi:tetratricopeptide (TPR) repeat protein
MTKIKTTATRLLACTLVGLISVSLVGCGGAEARKARHLDRGNRYLAENNLEKARVEFRNALQIAPKDATALYENGVVDERLGNMVEAVQFYKAALDVDADHVAALVALAKLTLLGGRPEQALETIKPAFAKHPEDARLLSLRAAAENAMKNPSAALGDAEHAVRLDPASLDAVAVLAGIYQSRGETDKARTLLEGTLKRVPDSVDLRLMLFYVYSSLDMRPQAESTLIELTKLRPTESAHRIRLARYYARMKQPDAAEATLREAIKASPADPSLKGALIDFLASERGRDVAERELAALIAAAPNDANLRFEAARFYEQGKNYDQAEREYREVMSRFKLEGPGLTARNRLASLKVLQNDLAGARKLVDEVLAGAPRDDDALVLRGNLALRQKDPKAAIADLRAVLRDQPGAVGVMRTLARAHVANGEPDLAAEILRRALETNPNDTALRLDLAQLMAETDGALQAKPLIDELAKQQPDNTQVLDTQFKIAMATGDLVTAKGAADAIVAKEPQSSTALFYQGSVAEAGHRLEEAAKIYSTALDVQPDAVEPLRSLARVLAELKRMPEALKRLDAVIQKYPQSVTAALIKGDLYMGLQQPKEAVPVFRIVIERDPKSVVGYARLASAQIADRDNAGSIATLKDGIDKSSNPEPLQVSLASLYESMNEPDEAAGLYEAALRRNPQADVAANNLAMLLVNHKKDSSSLDRAAQLASRVAQSSSPVFLDTYGWVLYTRGEAAAAVVALRNVIAKVPESPIALYHLGMAQVLAGETDAARDNLSHALKSGKQFSGWDEAKAELDRLEGRTAGGGPPKS